MKSLFLLYDRATRWLVLLTPALLPTLARLTFAGVLLLYFWTSALTKIGHGPLGFLHPSDGAYLQIFPRLVDSLGYDFSKLSWFNWAIVVAGMLAEFALPLLIVAGLFTRLASLGMIGFIAVQSLTDIFGHGIAGADIGRWFDAESGSLIFDQRGLWVFVLASLFFSGAGPVSLDRVLAGNRGTARL